jgi:transketolase
MIQSEILAKRIRETSLKLVHRARASHIGSALSIADIVAVLYGDVMRHDPIYHDWPERDRFILSKGHACVALYATLSEFGYISEKELLTYGEDFSWLMNHISHKVSGVEFSTGALGHGLPFGVGKALSAKRCNSSWQTYVLLSDGEMDEGSNWEALMFASHYKLNNLTAIIDYNKLQSLDSIQNTLGLEPLAEKFKSFGWHTQEIDGHSHSEIRSALMVTSEEKPKAIIAHTTKGKGVGFMENSVEWHYKFPDLAQLQVALSEL